MNFDVRRRVILILLFLFSTIALASDKTSTIDNGIIRVGIDLHHGGSISYIAESKTLENIVNTHDLGRFIGQSYYSGPKPYGHSNSKWKSWPWNPVSGGDVYGHPGKILAYSNDGKTIYVKVRPMQWALNSVECKCTFETWISLDGFAVHVRNRLVNSRSDSVHISDDQVVFVFKNCVGPDNFTRDGTQISGIAAA